MLGKDIPLSNNFRYLPQHIAQLLLNPEDWLTPPLTVVLSLS